MRIGRGARDAELRASLCNDDRFAAGDDEGVFELGAAAAVGSAEGPAVGSLVHSLGAGREEGFDGHDQAFPEEGRVGAMRGVGDVRRFVDVAADAVAAEVAHDFEARAFGASLNGAGDVSDGATGADFGHAIAQSPAGCPEECSSASVDLADGEACAAVCPVAVEFGGDVDVDEVTVAKDALFGGDAVGEFVVDADARGGGEVVSELWRGARAVLLEDAATNGVELGSGDAGFDGSTHGVACFSHGGADAQQGVDVALISDRHGFRIRCGPARRG